MNEQSKRNVPSEFLETAPLYVLDALTPEERERFEDRLSVDTELRAEVDALRATAGEIGFVAEPVVPPPSLRESVLQAAGPKRPGVLHYDPSLLIFRSDDVDWRPYPGTEGLYVKTLFFDKKRGYLTTLLKMDAGAVYPAHVHKDVEEIYVIDGEVELQGTPMGPGDYCRAEIGSRHNIGYSKTAALLLILSSAQDEVEV